MMFNFAGVAVGMVHYLLPPMVLILLSVMQSIDFAWCGGARAGGAPAGAPFGACLFP